MLHKQCHVLLQGGRNLQSVAHLARPRNAQDDRSPLGETNASSEHIVHVQQLLCAREGPTQVAEAAQLARDELVRWQVGRRKRRQKGWRLILNIVEICFSFT